MFRLKIKILFILLLGFVSIESKAQEGGFCGVYNSSAGKDYDGTFVARNPRIEADSFKVDVLFVRCTEWPSTTYNSNWDTDGTNCFGDASILFTYKDRDAQTYPLYFYENITGANAIRFRLANEIISLGGAIRPNGQQLPPPPIKLDRITCAGGNITVGLMMQMSPKVYLLENVGVEYPVGTLVLTIKKENLSSGVTTGIGWNTTATGVSVWTTVPTETVQYANTGGDNMDIQFAAPSDLPESPVFADAIDDTICGGTPFSTVTSSNYALTKLPNDADTCIWYLTYAPKTGTHVAPGDAQIISVPAKGVSGITIDWKVENTYYINVYAHNAQGNSDTISQKVTVEETPELLTAPVFVCAPNKADLTTAVTNASDFASFKYYTDDACTAAVATPSDVATGVYHIVGFTAGGCTDTASVNVNINSGTLSLNVQESLKYCSGGKVDLYDAIINPVSGAAYEYAASGSFAALNRGTLVTGTTAPGTEYTVRISTAAAGCGSASATVAVIESTDAPALANATAIHCTGGQIDLSTVFSDSYTYEYADNSGFSPLLTSSLVQGTPGGKPYYIKYAESSGCNAGTFATITVTEKATAPALASGDANHCTGGKVDLASFFDNSYTYEYAYNNTFSPILTSSLVQGMPDGKPYYVQYAPSSGCTAAGGIATITVTETTNAPSLADGIASHCATGHIDLANGLDASYTYEYADNNTFTPLLTSSLVQGTQGGGTPYYVRYSTSSKCATGISAKITVTEITVPSFDFPSDLSYCADGAALGGAIPAVPAGVSYEYSTDGTFGTGGTALAAETTVPAGTYYIRLAEGMKCAAKTDTVSVQQLPSSPVFDFPPVLSYCADGAALGGAIPAVPVGASYEYSTDGDFTTGGLVLTADTKVVAGTYYIRLASSMGCTAQTDTVTVEQLPPLVVFDFPPVLSYCDGGSAALGAAIPAVPVGASYEYSKDGTFGTGVSTLVSGTMETEGTYYIRLASSMGCTVKGDTVIVNKRTAPLLADGSMNHCTGGLVDLANGLDNSYTYEYADNSGFSPLLTSSLVQGLIGGKTYYIKYAQSSGCSASGTAKITVTETTTAPALTDGSMSHCTDGLVDLASGFDDSYTYEYADNSGFSPLLTSSLVQGTPGGMLYYVQYAPSSGCTASGAAKITVTETATSMAPALADGVASHCATGHIDLANGFDDSYTYEYAKDNTFLPLLTSSLVQGTPDGKDYFVRYAGSSKCATGISAKITVTEITVPTFDFPPVLSYCDGGAAALGAAIPALPAGASYEYSTDGDFTTGATALTADTKVGTDTYYIRLAEGMKCPGKADTVTVQQLPAAPVFDFQSTVNYCTGGSGALGAAIPAVPVGASYEYSKDGTFGTGVSTLVSGTMETEGTYYIRLAEGMKCAGKTDTVTVKQLPSAPVLASGDANHCTGGKVDLALFFDNSYTYEYAYNNTFSPILTSSLVQGMPDGKPYYVQYAPSSGCTAAGGIATIMVTETPKAPDLADGIASHCATGHIDLANGLDDSYTYEFADNSVFSPLLTSSLVQGSQGGTPYYVRYATFSGCNAGTSAKIMVTETTVPSFDFPATLSYCTDGAALGVAIPAVPAGVSYEYSTDGTFNTGVSSLVAGTTVSAGTYYIRLTEGMKCAGKSDTVQVNLIADCNLIVEAGSVYGSVCRQGGALLRVTSVSGGVAPYTYQWYEEGQESTILGYNKELPLGAPLAAKYVVKVTDNANNAATATVTIVSDGTRTAPLASAGHDMTILQNKHTVLLGSASGGTVAYDWHWSPADKLRVLADSAVQYPQTADLTVSQEYTLYVVDAQGCMSSPDTVNVNVDEVNGLKVEIIPAAATICAGNSQALNTVVTGNTGGGTLSYSWTPADLVSGAILPNPDFLPAASGKYILTVAVANGTYRATAKTTITVTADEAPEVEFNDDIYCKGDTLWVYDGNMNVPSDTYRWFVDGVQKQNGSDMFYTFDTEGTFDVKVIGEVTGGCVSDTAYKTVSINPVPTLAWNVKPAVAVIAGSTFTGSVTVSSGTPAYTYHWVSPAVPEFVTNDGNFIVNGAVGSAYDFEVYATDAKTCRTNTLKETTLVNPAGVLSVDVQSRHGDVICQNGVAFLDVSVAAGIAPYRYEWYAKDQPNTILRSIVKNSDRDTFLIASAVTAKYMVRVLDANSYAGIDSVEITNSSDIAPLVEAGPDLTIISGGKTVLLGSATQGTGGYTWHWSPAEKLDAADECTKQNPLTASLNASQKYKVYVTDDKNCVSPFDSTTVKIDPNGFVLGITPQTAVMCMGGSQMIKTTVTPKSNLSSAAVYKWIPAAGLSVTDKDASLFTPSASGDYTFVVTLTDGAKVAAVRTEIEVKANVTPVFSLQKTGDCQRDTVKIIYAPGSTDRATQYEWKVNNVVMAYTGERLVLSNSGVNVVEVTGKNSECSSVSQTITVNVNAAPEINNLAVVDSCGQAVVEVSASGATQPYMWTITPSAGGQDPTNTDRYIIGAIGTYQVKVTADNGVCKANKEIAATVHERPELNAWKVAPADCAAGEPIYAQVLATKGAPAYVYHWLQPTVASGDSYTIASAKFANYTFEVYAEDAMHCLSDTLKTPVKVEDGVMEVKITSVYGDVVCKGGAAMLVAKAEGAATPCTFKWYEKNTPGTVIRSANQAGGVLDTLWVNPASDTEYVVDVTDATVPVLKGADTVLLKINNTWQAPVVSAGPDMTVVMNSATVLLGRVTTVGTPDYQWHWGPVAQLATVADTGYQYPQTARLTARQQYQVYVVDANHCVSKRDVAEVNIDPNAFCVEINPQDPSICRSNSVVLESQITCGSVNPQTAVYAWSPSAGLLGKTDTALVTFGPTTVNGEYTYAVSVTDNGRTAAARTKVTVRNADAPVLALSGDSDCKADTLSVVNSGEPETSFVWNVDGLTVLSGAGKNKLPLDFTGTHRVEVYALAANGCQSDIETRDMKLGEVPPVSIVENHFADYRDSVFELHVVNDPTLMNGDFTYAWTSTPTAKINGATDELTMKSAAMDDDVEYIFTATSKTSAACKAADTVRAYIIPDAPRLDIDNNTSIADLKLHWKHASGSNSYEILSILDDPYNLKDGGYSVLATIPYAQPSDTLYTFSPDNSLRFFYVRALRTIPELKETLASFSSDTVGYYLQHLAVFAKGSMNIVSYPFDMSSKGIVTQKDLATILLENKAQAIQYWEVDVQKWKNTTPRRFPANAPTWIPNNFELEVGQSYFINVKSDVDLLLFGRLQSKSYSLGLKYNLVYLPYLKAHYDKAGLVGNEINNVNIQALQYWDHSVQKWQNSVYVRFPKARWNPDFAIKPLMPLFFNMKNTGLIWP